MAKNRKSKVGKRKLGKRVGPRSTRRGVGRNPSPARQRISKKSATKLTPVSSQNLLKRRFLITRKRILIFLIIVGLVASAFYKKHWIIAATVDGSPIIFSEVLSRMNKQYGQQTLNQIINEKIILSEAAKKGVVIGEKEIDEKMSQLETTFGGAEGLDAVLSQQRQTRSDLRRELRLQLSMEKLYDKEASVSAEEIDKFISENRAQLAATDSASQRKEAQEALRQQKLSKIFSEKFQQLRQQVKITIF